MAIKPVITSALVAVMTVGSLLPMASAASARDFDNRYGGKGNYSKPFKPSGNYDNRNNGWRGRDHGNQYAYGGPPRRHRDHTGRNLAIGAFATILGIAIASEINRNRRGGYDY